MRKLYIIFSFLIFTLFFLGPSYSCEVEHMAGNIYCDRGTLGAFDALDTPYANIKVSITGTDGYSYETTTDANGYYYIPLPIGDLPPATYTLHVELPPGASIVLPTPPPITYTTSPEVWYLDGLNVLINSPECQQKAGLCWMTAGGVKFDPLLMQNIAEKGPKFNFGGNTAPSCSLFPGEGGQWNFVDRAENIHFQAWVIEGVECYNISGPPPGTKSPVAPYNTIEFWGTGTVKPVSTNGAAKGKVAASDPIMPVKFWAHFEDRNEPGNLSAGPNTNDGAKVDRLYVRVYTDLGTVYLVEDPYLPGDQDPVLITGGNIQIHPCK